mmetsp:Transcript_47305/g.78500  ORF Transcript_47305/g.78500 Transcript_47305/m.78500 type:complete len:239 (-) Transcript_47305:78-794(-)
MGQCCGGDQAFVNERKKRFGHGDAETLRANLLKNSKSGSKNGDNIPGKYADIEISTFSSRNEQIVNAYIFHCMRLSPDTNVNSETKEVSTMRHLCLLYLGYELGQCVPTWFNQQYPDQSQLYLELCAFIRTLPSKSRTHIWSHSVKLKSKPKGHEVFAQTGTQQHILALIADCLIVFIKYRHQQKKPLKPKATQRYVTYVAMYIYNKYHPLQQEKFETDKNYLADMIEEYINNELQQQ